MLRKDMGVAHYLPFLNWVRHYNWSYVRGDFIAALTMASLYIPMALSLAANLGHVPAINGLYSFVFNPIIYALLGSCPQLVVGPEAAGSLLVGTVIKTSIDRELSGEEDLVMHARIAGVVTGMAGAVIFIAGMMRLGFLEGILSRPFLRGFISGIGFVIFVDQLIPQMGLSHRAKALQASHGSSVEKLVFLAENISHAHGPTCAVAFGSFAIIMVLRYITCAYQQNILKANSVSTEQSRKSYSPDTHPWRTSRIALSSLFSPLCFLGNFNGNHMGLAFWETSSRLPASRFLSTGLSYRHICSTSAKQWGPRS